jgi:hypothetical protein
VRRNQGRGSGSERSIRRVDFHDSGGEPSRETTDPVGRSNAELAGQLAGRSAAIEHDSVSGTVLAVPSVELESVAYDHQLDAADTAQKRPLVLLDLENTGEEPLRWNPSRTRFLGTDDYTYQPSSLSLDPDRFGPGCHTRSVTIEPGRRARVVTLIEELPAGVEIEAVVHRFRRGRIEVTLT